MTFTWLAGACIVGAASLVQGLAGFGIGLVAMAFLPFLMSPATAVVLMTIYATAFTAAIFLPVRRDLQPRAVVDLLGGTLIGAPIGVWVLSTLPAGGLKRLIGLVLVGIVLLEWLGRYPEGLSGRGWGVGAGVVAGLLGGAVGTPGPPVILYGTARGWGPRTMKANLQAFLVANQGIILLGYWWAGLLTPDIWRLVGAFAVPAVAGLVIGMALFTRIDRVRFRRIVFGLLFVSGLVLLVGG